MLLFSGSWCMRDFVCALQDWCVCFPYFCRSPEETKSICLSRSDDQKFKSFVRTMSWVPWCQVQNFHNRGRTSLVFCSPVTHQMEVWIWIHCDCTPPYYLVATSTFLWTWGIIFSVFQHPPVDSCPTASCSYCVAGGGKQTSCYRQLETEASEIQFGIMRWAGELKDLGLPQAGRSGTVWPLDICRPRMSISALSQVLWTWEYCKFIICKVSLLNPVLLELINICDIYKALAIMDFKRWHLFLW